MADLLTTKDAAERLNVSVKRVQALIRAGRLPAKKIGRDYMIDPRGLKAVENRQTGRPRKGTGK